MQHVRQDAASVYPLTYQRLLQTARGMFDPGELERLVPRLRGGPRLAEVNGHGAAGLDPIAATEAIAYDFLARGGKYSRPFITLAAYDALTGLLSNGEAGDSAPDRANASARSGEFGDAVRRTALSIEAFHKASLVHDDIQDGDLFRYGEPSLYAQHGVPTAINVGDYLIGLGYRLVSRDSAELGAEVAADILNKLAEAHTKLSEGQGAELIWRDGRNKKLTPDDALKIYALKTAPAFEAAMYSGLRLAGAAEDYAAPVAQFAKHLGVAFQILNDLQDWRGDNDNKLAMGGDVFGGRPTVLWAIALERLSDGDRQRLVRLIESAETTPAVIEEVRELYQRAGVFDAAEQLVAKHREKAAAVANAFSPEPLRRLAWFLIESVLERPAVAGQSQVPHSMPAR
jgi:geranylgeranyl pyrophosphate synthase